MIVKGPEFKKAMLLGLVLAAAPSFYYPYAFGWKGALAGSAGLFLLEFAYYGVMFYLFWRRTSISRILGAAVVAMGFRLGLGTLFSMLLAALFGLSVGSALSTGLYGYLPGVLLHVIAVPFMLQSVFDLRQPRRVAPAPRKVESLPTERRTPTHSEPTSWNIGSEQVPDFNAAVEHIATYSAVRLALLVDDEGLSVARAGRAKSDSDLWAPVTNLLFDALRRELRRTPDSVVHRFELTQTDQRCVAVRVEPFYLTVLFDSTSDELVNVRIAQAAEMIKRYAEHKYPKVARRAATEVAYV